VFCLTPIFIRKDKPTTEGTLGRLQPLLAYIRLVNLLYNEAVFFFSGVIFVSKARGFSG
jgi:hypothetical protein